MFNIGLINWSTGSGQQYLLNLNHNPSFSSLYFLRVCEQLGKPINLLQAIWQASYNRFKSTYNYNTSVLSKWTSSVYFIQLNIHLKKLIPFPFLIQRFFSQNLWRLPSLSILWKSTRFFWKLWIINACFLKIVKK